MGANSGVPKLYAKQVVLAFYRYLTATGLKPLLAVQTIQDCLTEPSPGPDAHEAFWVKTLMGAMRLEEPVANDLPGQLPLPLPPSEENGQDNVADPPFSRPRKADPIPARAKGGTALS